MFAGFMDGFVRTVLSLLAVVAAFLAGSQYAERAGSLFERWLDPEIAGAVGFTAVFVGVIILFSIVTLLLRKALDQLSLTGFDRMLGTFLGFVRAAILVGLLAVVVDGFGGFAAARRSKTFSYALATGKTVVKVIPEKTREKWRWKIQGEGVRPLGKDEKPRSRGDGSLI
jgi:uncharacterized membrane protein required for colicin V production